MTWDDYFLNLLGAIASKSKDKSTQVGCIIVGPHNEIRSTGYNSFPRGFKRDDDPTLQERPEKYFWFEHAERNAIYNAARIGTSLQGCHLYTDGMPCIDCARGIASVGITKVILKSKFVPERWKESCSRSLQLFSDCGVKVYHEQSLLLR